jgi:hypothetical protein
MLISFDASTIVGARVPLERGGGQPTSIDLSGVNMLSRAFEERIRNVIERLNSLTSRVEAARARGYRDLEAEEELRRLLSTDPDEPGEATLVSSLLYNYRRSDPYDDTALKYINELNEAMLRARRVLSTTKQ